MMEIGHEIISTAIRSLPLIQEGQLSVTGEKYAFTAIMHLLDVIVTSGLTSISTIFSHITTVSGCDRELNAHFYSAHFYSAATLKYHAPDT